jgi:tRNA pseudouridine55 synthase
MTSPGTADGLLLADKPAGVSSHDVVGAARRAFGEKQIGHAGTLDPFATGLLVLLVGRATRLLPHMPGEPKVYDATIAFGGETDTEDLLGTVIREAPRPSREALLAALPALTGSISQVPPAYSAKRVDGERAYKAARRGEDVVLKPVQIVVHRWEVTDIALDASGAVETARVRVTCGGGTYVRSLARDLARNIGSAAHLSALRRVRSGPFDVADAHTIEDLREGRAVLRPALDALHGFPRQQVDVTAIAKIVRGQDVDATIDDSLEAPWAALVRADRPEVLVALAERDAQRWRPRVVMREVAVEA